MSITLGGKRWNEVSIYDDDYRFEKNTELSPLDDDYIIEEYRMDDD